MAELKEKGLSLRDPSKRKLIYDELKKLYARDLNKLPDFIVNMPQKEARVLTRPIKFGLNWKL
jgi:lambda repressor-like predicted transcriptional regulator